MSEPDLLRAHIVNQNAEIERLSAQLPEGMKHCTILFKECEKGHGRLTAANWIEHGCSQCEIECLRADKAELLATLKDLQDGPGIGQPWYEFVMRVTERAIDKVTK